MVSLSLVDVNKSEKDRKGFAWTLCWLMFASTVLNYMDRQAISVVGDLITVEFGLRYEQFGWVIAAFQLSYAFFQVPAGFLTDRWNVRWTYAAAVLWWSLSAVAVAFSPTFGLLLVFRAILGVGEAFNWPCALKVTSAVLPPEDRGLGNGIFNSGAAVGAVLTPLILAPLTAWLGWRWAFAIIGASGLIWVAVWLLSTRSLSRTLADAALKHRAPSNATTRSKALIPFVALTLIVMGLGVVGFFWTQEISQTSPELKMAGELGLPVSWKINEGDQVRRDAVVASFSHGGEEVEVRANVDGSLLGRPGQKSEGRLTYRHRPLGLSSLWLSIAGLMVGWLVLARLIPERLLKSSSLTESLGRIVRLERFWVMCVVSISINVCWHFLVNWLPTYLKTDRGMNFAAGTMLSAIPFLAADLGNIGGGALARGLSRRTRSVVQARLLLVGISVILISLGATVGQIRSDTLTIIVLAVMALGTAAFMANYFSFCQDVSEPDTGLVVGILGGVGNLFAAGFAPIVGRIKDTSGDFGPVFLMVGLLPFVGFAALAYGWRGELSRKKPA